MRDIFFTILVVWLLWRIFNSFSSSSKTNYNSRSNSSATFKKEGEVTIEKSGNKKNDDGEYTDYEEIK